MTEATKTRNSISILLPDGTVRGVETNEFRRRVFRHLEVVNKKLKRAATVAEVVHSCCNSRKLLPAENKKMADSVNQALRFLAGHELIFTRKQNGRRTYGSFRVLDPNAEETIKPPVPLRYKLLALVRETVAHANNRAVRCRDVIEYAEECRITDLSRNQIVYNMWSLTRTGELRIAGRMRGDGFGRTLFLPAELYSIEARDSTGKLTFIDLVLRTFEQLWQERAEQAKLDGGRIRPVSTAEIQIQLKQSPETSLYIKRNWTITRALRGLAEKENPEIRSIVQPNKLRLWISASCRDEEIDLKNTYSSNALKVAAAVERAYRNAGKRPVNLKEIKKEITNDRNLTLTGKNRLSEHLFGLVWRKGVRRGKSKAQGRTQLIRSTGSIRNHAYFAPAAAPLERCNVYIEFHKLKYEWEKLKQIEGLHLIADCRLPSAQTGRLRLFLQETELLIEKLSRLKAEFLDHEYPVLGEEIKNIREQILGLLNERCSDELPNEVNQLSGGLTCAETAEFLAPFYPVAARINKNETKYLANKLSGRIRHAFRQIPNPEFRIRSSPIPRFAAEFLFEQTDLLLGTALKWGGDECRYQASIAKQELGSLRDAGFIVPGLISPDFEQRLAAIACLAFLQKEPGKLRELAINDPVSEVRQAALWSYSFMNGQNYQQLARQISGQDSNPATRAFASRIAQLTYQLEIWEM